MHSAVDGGCLHMPRRCCINAQDLGLARAGPSGRVVARATTAAGRRADRENEGDNARNRPAGPSGRGGEPEQADEPDEGPCPDRCAWKGEGGLHWLKVLWDSHRTVAGKTTNTSIFIFCLCATAFKGQ